MRHLEIWRVPHPNKQQSELQIHEEGKMSPALKEKSKYWGSLALYPEEMSTPERHFIEVAEAISRHNDTFRLGMLQFASRMARITDEPSRVK